VIAGQMVAALALFLLAFGPEHVVYTRDLLLPMALLGLGGGLCLPALTLIAMSDTSPADSGLASGLVRRARAGVRISAARQEEGSEAQHQAQAGVDLTHEAGSEGAQPLGELLLVHGGQLGHIDDRLSIETTGAGRQDDVPGPAGEALTRRDRRDEDGSNGGPVEAVR
jgi:hypothetical protein